MSEIFSRETIYKGEPCVEIFAGGYYALIIPAMGSNVIRLRDTVRKIDVLNLRCFDQLILSKAEVERHVLIFRASVCKQMAQKINTASIIQ